MPVRQAILKTIDGRIVNAIKSVYDECRMLYNHNKGVRYVRTMSNTDMPLRVQFGCGPIRKEGWLNTDIWPGPWAKPDICLDVSRDLPFASNSVTEIYSEHMFEHLDYPNAVKRFLVECFRVLKPDGLMTIGVPDLDAIYRRYESIASGTSSAIELKEHYILGHPVEELNYCFHQGGEHKFLYNEDFLITLLRHFGFRSVERRPFDTGIDSEYRREGTLYVCARKPCAKRI